MTPFIKQREYYISIDCTFEDQIKYNHLIIYIHLKLLVWLNIYQKNLSKNLFNNTNVDSEQKLINICVDVTIFQINIKYQYSDVICLVSPSKCQIFTFTI